jgi:hypothetical protein
MIYARQPASGVTCAPRRHTQSWLYSVPSGSKRAFGIRARQRVYMRSAPASGFTCAPRPPVGLHALRAGIPKAGFTPCLRVRKGRLAYATVVIVHSSLLIVHC